MSLHFLNNTVGLQQAAWLACFVVLGLGLFLWLVRRQGWVLKPAKPMWQFERSFKFSFEIIYLIAVILLGLMVRLFFINQPMRGDEANTFLKFVNGGFSDLFNYPAPNNHVLNTILIKGFVGMLGATPAVIRLPAFLAGVLGMAAIYQLMKDFFRRGQAGVAAALMTAVFPYFILYSTNARGYTLLVLISIWLVQFGLRLIKNFSALNGFVFIWLAALGMWTMPVMALVLAGLFLWLAVLFWLKQANLWVVLEKLALLGLGIGLITIILYLPIVVVSNGVQAITHNAFVEPKTYAQIWPLIVPQLQKTGLEWFRDIHPVVLGVSFIFFGWGYLSAIRKKDWKAVMLLPAFFLGVVLVVLFQRVMPYPRTMMYFLPFIFLFIAYGFDELMKKTAISVQRVFLFFLGCFSFAQAAYLIQQDVITRYPDTSAFQGAPLAVQTLKPILQPNDRLRISRNANESVNFYFWYYQVPYPTGNGSSYNNSYIVLKPSEQPLSDFTDQPVILLIESENMQLYQVEK